ncbi:MAG: CDP-diacylglycerol--serine O-phosphatidyltransferase [Nanoarchaeota archaeon]
MAKGYLSIFQVTFPDIVTFLNVSLGFSSMAASALQHWDVAFALLIGAMIMDYLDGKVARALNQTSELGTNLDSLSDMVSFGAAPAFLLLSKNGFAPILWVTSVIFISCGAFRLGRYNLLHKVVKGWVGMPITTNAIILPVASFLTSNTTVLAILMLLSSGLMVSSIKVKRFF